MPKSPRNLCSENFPSKDSRGGSNKKHYIITGETYKTLLMIAQTAIGKIQRKYYIKVETLAATTIYIMTQCKQFIVKKETSTNLVAKESNTRQIVNRQLKINEVIIESRDKDNFINATQLCKTGGKKFQDWTRLESTKELLKQLEETLKTKHSDEKNDEKSKTGYPVLVLIDVKRVISSIY